LGVFFWGGGGGGLGVGGGVGVVVVVGGVGGGGGGWGVGVGVVCCLEGGFGWGGGPSGRQAFPLGGEACSRMGSQPQDRLSSVKRLNREVSGKSELRLLRPGS